MSGQELLQLLSVRLMPTPSKEDRVGTGGPKQLQCQAKTHCLNKGTERSVWRKLLHEIS